METGGIRQVAGALIRDGLHNAKAYCDVSLVQPILYNLKVIACIVGVCVF